MNTTRCQESRLKGVAICEGVAVGRPYLYAAPEAEVPYFAIDDVQGEIERYRDGLKQSRHAIAELKRQLETEGAIEGAAILGTHLVVLRDPSLTTAIEEKIRERKENCEYLFHQAIQEYERQFLQFADSFFRERLSDLKDVARRVLSRLRQVDRPTMRDLPADSVVFADDLTPSDAAEAEHVAGFVTRGGSETSHAAIMAKARGIPYVANVGYADLDGWQEGEVVVDGRRGEVIFCPSQATLDRYRAVPVHLAEKAELVGKVAETIDGVPIVITANLEMIREIDSLQEMGANGIGLFRSEYLCLSHGSFPSEEEQFAVYRNIAEKMGELPVVIRTFDVGGDKVRDLPNLSNELNPYLGCRAIRYMLREAPAFRSQLRAILRASVYGDIRILFPMITSLHELQEAKRHLEEVRLELEAQGVPCQGTILVGCMIEVPSAAITCDLLAPHCDFFSIGTNDLVQYALAVDRGNQVMRYLYSPAHPCVLRLIRMVAAGGASHRIPVSLCGEVASDPRFTALLVGLGVTELSMAPRYIPTVQQAVRRVDLVYAHQLAERALALSSAQEVMELLQQEHQRVAVRS
jgi:phosphoenolpyruvate-protein phosphotransferase (PTS system enzyme I)